MSSAQSTTSYRWGMFGDAMYEYNGDMTDGGGNFSSESWGSGNFYSSLHQHDQYPSGMDLDCSSMGYLTGHSYHSYTLGKPSYGMYLISHVMPPGVRPRRFFIISGNLMYEAPSMYMLHVQKDSVNLDTYRASGFKSRTQAYGAAGYNERTRTLVVTHGDSTNTLDVNVFTNPTVDLNSCAKLSDFFATATVKGFTISRTYNSENAYDRRVIVGDNGAVVVGMRNGSDLQGVVFNYNDTTPTAVALTTVGGTTSYGVGSGSYYYTKVQLSWDGKWALIYQPYYYYGCGFCAYIISTEDPTRYFGWRSTSTGGGGMLTPMGQSGFAYLNGSNTDSNGIAVNTISLKNTGRTGTGATVYASSSSYGATTAVSNGEIIVSQLSFMSVHGGYYSTSYPRFLTVNWWPINGKRTYEGAVK